METVTLFTAAAVVILFSIADLLGLLDNLPSIKAQAPVVTLAVLGIVLAYLVIERRSSLDRIDMSVTRTFEHLQVLEARLLLPELMGVEVFGTTEDMMQRITSVTVGAEQVSTLNLSPPLGFSPVLDSYFRAVSGYLRSGNPALRSYRILSSLESPEKARWTLARAVDLVPTGKVSCAVIPGSILSSEAVTDILLGFHVVRRAGVTYVFFYRYNMHIDPTEVTDCFLLKNSEVGEVICTYFDRLWRRAVPLHIGRHVDSRGLAEIVKIDPSIADDVNYLRLSEQAFPGPVAPRSP